MKSMTYWYVDIVYTVRFVDVIDLLENRYQMLFVFVV